MLGVSYLLGIMFGYGITGVYVGIVLAYVCWAGVAAVGFIWGDWANTAAKMMAERAEVDQDRQQTE